jgi:hypothetical protein
VKDALPGVKAHVTEKVRLADPMNYIISTIAYYATFDSRL